METTNKGIRFPADLIEKIEEIAAREKRTFSQEVMYLCEKGILFHQHMNDYENSAIDSLAPDLKPKRHAQ